MIPLSIPVRRQLRRHLAIAGLLLFAAVAVRAQEPAALNFAYSTSAFALDDTSSVVELYYQYSDRGLTYARVDGREVGQLMISFTVRDSLGNVVIATSWITTNAKPGPDEEDHALLGTKLFGLRPGRHEAQIAFVDVNSPNRHDSADFTLNVRAFRPGALALSDVQVISEIMPSDDQSNRFYKNGYVIYPNVLSSIEPPFLLLNTYVEVYNAHAAPTSQFEIIYALADSAGTLLYQKEEKRDRPTAAAIVDVHSIVVDELPSGPYYLLVKAFAGLRGTGADSSMVVRPFSIVNPEKDSLMALANGGSRAGGAILEADPAYAGMTEEELEREFEMLTFIALEREREIWKGLSGTQAKGRFLTEFWAVRDPNPATTANELREDYARRIEAANALYREPLVEHGYQSNRGRVMLQYGKPDQVERHYFDKNRRPYEIWVYSKDNLTFVFVDRSGMGKFVLVHSDAPGEVRQENWERLYATVHEYLDN